MALCPAGSESKGNCPAGSERKGNCPAGFGYRGVEIGGLGEGVDPPNNRKPIGYVFTHIVLFVLIPFRIRICK